MKTQERYFGLLMCVLICSFPFGMMWYVGVKQLENYRPTSCLLNNVTVEILPSEYVLLWFVIFKDHNQPPQDNRAIIMETEKIGHTSLEIILHEKSINSTYECYYDGRSMECYWNLPDYHNQETSVVFLLLSAGACLVMLVMLFTKIASVIKTRTTTQSLYIQVPSTVLIEIHRESLASND